MRAALFTYGSRGEFQPFLVLARALLDAGHEARLAAPPNPGFRELAAVHRVPFVAVGDPWRPEDVRSSVQRRLAVNDPVQIMRLIYDELMLKDIERSYALGMEASLGCDVVVSHYGYPLGRMVAESHSVPYVAVVLDPNSVPTATRPPLDVPADAPAWAKRFSRGRLRHLVGRRANAALWRATMGTYERAFVPSFNAARARVGLPPLRATGADALLSPELNLVPVSPAVLTPPSDWAPRSHMTGYWLFNGDPEPGAEIRRFVAGNPKPIAVTLGGVPGTLPTEDSDRVTGIILRAIELADARAVIEPGGRDLGRGELPPSVLRASVPHGWLLPRVAAVVHHGGVGTTGAVIRAGVPSVIVPHRWDQPFWAARAYELGVAVPPVPFGELSPERLAAAMRETLTDRARRERATSLGERVGRERGPQLAVGLIEARVVGRTGSRAGSLADKFGRPLSTSRP